MLFKARPYSPGLRFVCFANSRSTTSRGVAINSGLGGGGGGRFKSETFSYRKYEGRIKESNVSSSC